MYDFHQLSNQVLISFYIFEDQRLRIQRVKYNIIKTEENIKNFWCVIYIAKSATLFRNILGLNLPKYYTLLKDFDNINGKDICLRFRYL